MKLLGIDVGGSAVRGAIVRVETGNLDGERVKVPVAPTFLPGDVLGAIVRIQQGLGYEGPIGVGFPSVVREGVVRVPATARSIGEWIDYPVARRLAELTGCPTTVINDADAAGLAEMRFGAGRGERGVVVTLTFGTGIGSGLFIGGRLVPNSEMGCVHLRGGRIPAEQYAAARIREEQRLSWREWGDRVNEYLRHLELLLSPDLIIVGGGVSKWAQRFLPRIHVRARVVPARLENQAGMVGAALAGSGRAGAFLGGEDSGGLFVSKAGERGKRGARSRNPLRPRRRRGDPRRG